MNNKERIEKLRVILSEMNENTVDFPEICRRLYPLYNKKLSLWQRIKRRLRGGRKC